MLITIKNGIIKEKETTMAFTFYTKDQTDTLLASYLTSG